jgi:hypothetical protein
MNARTLRRLFAIWPPFRFSGIRVEALSDDWRYARVRLKLRWYNRNYVRTQFGGALFAMADPFWMVMLINTLGRDYVVWDKAGAIDFITPGREDVFAEFLLDDATVDEIRAATANGEKLRRWFGSTSRPRPATCSRACASSFTCGAGIRRGTRSLAGRNPSVPGKKVERRSCLLLLGRANLDQPARIRATASTTMRQTSAAGKVAFTTSAFAGGASKRACTSYTSSGVRSRATCWLCSISLAMRPRAVSAGQSRKIRTGMQPWSRIATSTRSRSLRREKVTPSITLDSPSRQLISSASMTARNAARFSANE